MDNNIFSNSNQQKKTVFNKETNSQFTLKSINQSKNNIKDFKHIKLVLLINILNEIENNKIKSQKIENLTFNDFLFDEQNYNDSKDLFINKENIEANEYIQTNNNSVNNNNIYTDKIRNIEKEIKELESKLKDSNKDNIIIDKIKSLIKLKLIILIKILESSKKRELEEDRNIINVESVNMGDELNKKDIKNIDKKNNYLISLFEYFYGQKGDKIFNINKSQTTVEYIDTNESNNVFIGKKRTKSVDFDNKTI